MTAPRDPRLRAFLDPAAPVIQGTPYRPITGGTLELCRDMDITFVDNFALLGDLTEDEGQRQIFTFLFIHGYTEPGLSHTDRSNIAAVQRAIALPRDDFREQYLIPFSMPIRMDGILSEVFSWVTAVNCNTALGVFQVLAKLVPPGEADSPNA
jgi:hypothetical protein